MKYSIVAIGEHAGLEANIAQLQVAVFLVEPNEAVAGAGDRILDRIARHLPAVPAMLVAIDDNGFRAYAHFQTHTLLAYLQIPLITWGELDIWAEPPEVEEELPF